MSVEYFLTVILVGIVVTIAYLVNLRNISKNKIKYSSGTGVAEGASFAKITKISNPGYFAIIRRGQKNFIYVLGDPVILRNLNKLQTFEERFWYLARLVEAKNGDERYRFTFE